MSERLEGFAETTEDQMLTGAEVFKYARCINGLKYYGDGAPDVDSQGLERVGKAYDMLVKMGLMNIYEIGAITACMISKLKPDGTGEVFKQGPVYTGAMVLVFILQDKGLRRVAPLSPEDVALLGGALREQNSAKVAGLAKKRWR